MNRFRFRYTAQFEFDRSELGKRAAVYLWETELYGWEFMVMRGLTRGY